MSMTCARSIELPGSIVEMRQAVVPVRAGSKRLPRKNIRDFCGVLMLDQDLELIYHDLGQFYRAAAAAWLAEKKMHTARIGMVVPTWYFIDIDTEDDWRRTELIFNALRESNA